MWWNEYCLEKTRKQFSVCVGPTVCSIAAKQVVIEENDQLTIRRRRRGEPDIVYTGGADNVKKTK